VVDHFHGDPAWLRFVEGAWRIAIERCPGFGVDLGFEGRLERAVGIVDAQKIGVADEEALLVVIDIDEPAGDALAAVTADLAGENETVTGLVCN
jgi:hypothetical protein